MWAVICHFRFAPSSTTIVSETSYKSADGWTTTIITYADGHTADVVVHDGLVSDEILDLAPPAAQRISVAKRKSRHSYSQDEINRMLVAFAQEGLNVVRLRRQVEGELEPAIADLVPVDRRGLPDR